MDYLLGALFAWFVYRLLRNVGKIVVLIFRLRRIDKLIAACPPHIRRHLKRSGSC